MHKKIAKAVTATLMATTLLSTTVATVVPMSVSAGEILGETTFEYKALPWHTCETNPAKQDFSLDNGTFHVKVKNPGGAAVGGESRWDLQTRCRNITLRAGHTYKVSWDVKVSRPGIQIQTKIGDISGDLEFWNNDAAGPHNYANPTKDNAIGSQWNQILTINSTSSFEHHESIWNCEVDWEAAEWAFHYGGAGDFQPSPCTQEGDEIWFDNMSIVDMTGSQDDAANVIKSYGQTSRDWSGELGKWHNGGETTNFISVNQIGYYSNLSKVATLGDNAGDILHGATKIDIGDSPLEYEIKDASTGDVKFTGKTVPISGIDPDSGDHCHTIDFTDFTTPGNYYIQIKGEDWRSFEFAIGDDIYNDAKVNSDMTSSENMLTNALNYFYQNRSGVDIMDKYITSGETNTKGALAHEGGHKTDKAAVQTEWVKSYASADDATGKYKSSDITATGGWYDAGDHGKYVVNGGISVWTLQNMYERAALNGSTKFDDGSGTVVVPETGNKVPDILDECAVELDWMTKMIVQPDEKTWGQYAGLVYHKLHDHKWTGLATRPYNYEAEWGTTRIVKPPTYTATLNFVACAAQAARLWEKYDSKKAGEYLSLAKTSYDAYKKFYKAHTGDNDPNPLWPPLDQAIGGGAYGDTKSTDDAYWAACELYATTGDSTYYDDLSKYEDAFKVVDYLEGGENKGSLSSFNWGCTASCGSLSLYLNKDNAKLTNLTAANKESIISSISDAADVFIKKENDQAYGIPYAYEGEGYYDPVNLDPSTKIVGFEWGSNSFVVNNAIVMAYAYDETQDIKYMNGIVTAMDYIFGRNPMSYSYVSGYGSYALKNPHHRYWSYELDSTLPMAPAGIMSGGANAGLQDPYVRALGFVPGENDKNRSERCYVDSIEAWSTNEVTINWNSPFAWVVSFLQDEAPNATDSGLKVTPSNVTVKVGETEKIEVKVDGKPADATFSSSDESIATVSPDGTVTGVAEGTTTITVTVGNETKTVNVTVKAEGSTDPTGETKPTDETNSTDASGETNDSYTGPKEDLIYGDVDLSGSVNVGDVTKLAKYFINKETYRLGDKDNTPESVAKAKEQADVEYNSTVDKIDLSKLIEHCLGAVSKDDLGPKK